MARGNFLYQTDSLTPDQGWLGNSGIGHVDNFVPVTGGYSPGPRMDYYKAMLASSSDIQGEVLGSVVWSNGATAYIVAAVGGGTSGYKVYHASLSHNAPTADWTDVTPASGWSQGTGNGWIIDTWGVQMTTYGDYIYITDGISGMFRKLASDTSQFAAISPATGGVAPNPKVIAGHNGHMIVGDVVLSSPHGSVASGRNSNLVWWSAFDDAQTFGSISTTPQHKGTDFKFLYDTPGNIIKIVPAGDVVFAFKEKAIYLGDGPPFRWSLLSRTIGTQFPNSTVFYNNSVYFMSDSGPAVVDRDGMVRLLLQGKAQRDLVGTSSAFAS